MKNLICLLVMAVLSMAAAVHAHGDGAGHAGSATVKQEQKAWGIAGDAKAVRHTINVKMSDDMRFTPARMQIRQGDTVRFVMKNDGKVMHEFVIGTKKDLDEHAALMMKFPDMEHDEPYMAHVAPGGTGSIIWRFNRTGSFDFACLIAGHYQAGMTGTIVVTAANAKK